MENVKEVSESEKRRREITKKTEVMMEPFKPEEQNPEEEQTIKLLWQRLKKEAEEILEGGKVEDLPKVVCIPGLCGGAPTIEGSRLRVEFILELWAHGPDAVEDVLNRRPYCFGRGDGFFEAAVLYGSTHPEVVTWGKPQSY